MSSEVSVAELPGTNGDLQLPVLCPWGFVELDNEEQEARYLTFSLEYSGVTPMDVICQAARKGLLPAGSRVSVFPPVCWDRVRKNSLCTPEEEERRKKRLELISVILTVPSTNSSSSASPPPQPVLPLS
jgi:hypothetical protein